MKPLAQCLAVAYTEFRFGLRRGGPVVGVAAVGLLTGGGAVYLAYANSVRDALPDLVPVFAPGAGARAVVDTWAVFLALTMVLLPMVCAPSIPSDRQYKALELLFSYPINGWIYLAGKVAGVWAVVILVGGATLALHLLAIWVLVGPPDWTFYLRLTLLGGLPLMLWSSALGILVGSVLHTRRLALFVGFLIGLISPVSGMAFRDPPVFNPANYPPGYSPGTPPILNLIGHQAGSDYVFQQFSAQYSLLTNISAVTPAQVALSLVCGGLLLLILLSLARFYLAWKENF